MSKKEKISKEDIEDIECRFVVHVQESYGKSPDLHYIKEQITLKDGRQVPNVRKIVDFKRPVWVTSPSFRNHVDHKESEDIDKLTRYETTESNLNFTVARALGKPYLSKKPRELKAEPYLYGYDVPSTVILKKLYLDKCKKKTPYKVSFFDIETSMADLSVLVACLVFGDKAFTVIESGFVKNHSFVEERLRELKDKYLPEYKDLNWEIMIVDSELTVIREAFKKAHEWMPDFMAIWNMDFDIPRIIDRLDRAGEDPIDYLCDPSLPREVRVCKYQKGQTNTLTASGKSKPLDPSAQWHSVKLTAPFYIIDAMCTYRQLRIANQESGSYALDDILQVELNRRKLKIDEAKGLEGPDLHIFMQNKYPLEYIVYNLFDCLGMQELDQKNGDLKDQIGVFCGSSEFSTFKSNPTKIRDDFYSYLLRKDSVIGTAKPNSDSSVVSITYDEEDVGDDEEGEATEHRTLGLDHWIITLMSSLFMDKGLKVLSDYPEVKTKIRAFVADADAEAAYPSATEALNVSKATTKYEIIEIKGIPETVFRAQNLGIVLGGVSSIEYAVKMFSLPDPVSLLDQIDI